MWFNYCYAKPTPAVLRAKVYAVAARLYRDEIGLEDAVAMVLNDTGLYFAEMH